MTEDDAFKSGVFICSNARLAFGFTGVAKCGIFNTDTWLLENLCKLGPPDFDAQSILDRLTEKATLDFSSLPSITNVSTRDKRLSVMFSGYLYEHSPPMAAYAIMTNFQNLETSNDDDKAWDSFKCTYCKEKMPRQENFTFIQRVGVWQAMSTSDEISLRALLSEHKPAKAIVDKAVQIIRDLADRPQAGGTIGKQLSSVILPRDFNIDPTTEYHSMNAKQVIYPTPMVVSTKEKQWAMARPEITSDAPIVFPKVGRNAPCPCGSGRKYKKCHGFR
ncbi:YecA family protein [Chloroflexota bacterium]